jgi:IS5 family transposase
MHLASAQQAEVKLAESTLASVRVPQPRGRPKTRPKEVVADKGYDSRALRQQWRKRGSHPCLPKRRGKQPRRGRKAKVTGYRNRWMVERTFAWLGHFRRLVVRYEHLLEVYQAFFLLACILICLRWVSEGVLVIWLER